MSTHSELLTVTLLRPAGGYNSNTTTLIHTMRDSLRSAPGLISINTYRQSGNAACYLILTNWEDQTSWKQASDVCEIAQLTRSGETHTWTPEQWHLTYIWGYHRSNTSSHLIMLHATEVEEKYFELARQAYLRTFHESHTQALLAFAFLAHGTKKQIASSGSTKPSFIVTAYASWSNENEKKRFYEDSHYQALTEFLKGIGTTRIFSLETFL